MSNKNRILHNDHKVAMIDIDHDHVIEMGDFVFIAIAADVSDDATITLGYGIPATDLVDAGSAADNRVTMAAQLLGIALQPSPSGDNDEKIAVGYNGTFILDQKTGAAIHIGDNIEIYSADPNADDQAIVEGDTSIIAKCIKTKTTTTAVTEVQALVQPALMNVA